MQNIFLSNTPFLITLGMPLSISLLCSCNSTTECQGPSSCPGGYHCEQGKCVTPGPDKDHDGIQDWQDKCPTVAPDPIWPISDQTDADGDGIGDICDNCPDVKNQDQRDSDGDGTGDKCQGEVIFEPEPYNDNPSSAHLLFFGVTVEGIEGSPDPGPEPRADMDFWLIKATRGQVLTLEARRWPDTSYADPMLILTDDATGGARLMRTNDDFHGTSNAHLEVLIPATGFYRVQVLDYINYFHPDSPVGGIRYGYRLRASKLTPPLTVLEPRDQKIALDIEPGKLAMFRLNPTEPGLLATYLTSNDANLTMLSVQDAKTGKILGQNSQRADCSGLPQSRIRLCVQKAPVNIVVETIGAAGTPARVFLELDISRASSHFPARTHIQAGRQSSLLELSQPSSPLSSPLLKVRAESATSTPAIEILKCPSAGSAPSTSALCQAGPDMACGSQVVLNSKPEQLYVQISERIEQDGRCGVSGLDQPMDVTIHTQYTDLNPQQPPNAIPADWTWTPEEPGAIGFWPLPGNPKVVYSVELSSSNPDAHAFGTIRDENLEILSRATPAKDGVTRLSWAPVNDDTLYLTVNDMLGGWDEEYGFEIKLYAHDLPSNLIQERTDASDNMLNAMPLAQGDMVISAQLGPESSDPADHFSLVVSPNEILSVRSWADKPGPPPDTSLVLMDEKGRVLALGVDTGRDALGSIIGFAGRTVQPLVLRVTLANTYSNSYRLEIHREQATSEIVTKPVGDDLSANEIMIDPKQDFNADGKTDFGDQFLELINTSSYTLDLEGLVIETKYATALFGQLKLSPGQAILLFNGQPPTEGLYHVKVFGLGNRSQWLSTGKNAVVFLRTDEQGAGLDLQKIFVPAVEPGHSANRIVDGDAQRVFRDHINVAGTRFTMSPGTRADGTQW